MNTDMNINKTGAYTPVSGLEQNPQTSAAVAAASSELPPVQGGVSTAGGLALPVLSLPCGGLSLESLVSGLGNDVRRQACRDGIDSLESRAKTQKETNDKQLEELQKQIAEMAKKEKLGGFLKAFKFIGMIVGAVASIASVAVGVMTANPLLVVGGVIALGMTVDSIVSEASGGKVSLMAGVSKLAEAMGADEQTAKWIALGVQITVTVVSMVCTLGAGAAGSAGAATSVVPKALQLAQKASAAANAGLAIAQGSGQIAGAVMDYKVANSQANTKELEAIMEQIREAMELDRSMVKAEMERAEALMSKVMDIVENCNDTQQAVLSASPSMA